MPCLALAAACTIGRGDLGDDDTGGGGGGGGGNGGGGGGGGEVAPDANCPAVSFTTTRTTPSVQLLIDRSLSMNYTLDSATNTSRYDAMGNVLVEVVGQLQGDVYFGASLYTQDGACPNINSTSSRALNNLSEVQALVQGFSPSGNTPTAAAFAQTAALFETNPPPAASPPIIVLATDGFPNNCQTSGDPQADTVSAVAIAHAKGIRTFVLGIAGVGGTFLQKVANAGQGVVSGQQYDVKYFTANSTQELQAAFEDIIGSVASCELAISGAVDPQVAESGTVTLNGAPLKYGTDWVVVNATTLRLEGAACSELKSSSNAHVEATFPCTAVVLI